MKPPITNELYLQPDQCSSAVKGMMCKTTVSDDYNGGVHELYASHAKVAADCYIPPAQCLQNNAVLTWQDSVSHLCNVAVPSTRVYFDDLLTAVMVNQDNLEPLRYFVAGMLSIAVTSVRDMYSNMQV